MPTTPKAPGPATLPGLNAGVELLNLLGQLLSSLRPFGAAPAPGIPGLSSSGIPATPGSGTRPEDVTMSSGLRDISGARPSAADAGAFVTDSGGRGRCERRSSGAAGRVRDEGEEVDERERARLNTERLKRELAYSQAVEASIDFAPVREDPALQEDSPSRAPSVPRRRARASSAPPQAPKRRPAGYTEALLEKICLCCLWHIGSEDLGMSCSLLFLPALSVR